MKYAKAIVAVLGAALVVVQAALTDETITTNEWLKIAIAGITAAGVYLVPNREPDDVDKLVRRSDAQQQVSEPRHLRRPGDD